MNNESGTLLKIEIYPSETKMRLPIMDAIQAWIERQNAKHAMSKLSPRIRRDAGIPGPHGEELPPGFRGPNYWGGL